MKDLKSGYMFAAPNAKIITIHKNTKPRNNNLVYERSLVRFITRKMNGKRSGGFHLWSIFRTYFDGDEIYPTAAIMEEQYGVAKDTYNSWIHSLIDSGFLIKGEKQHWHFYENPFEDEFRKFLREADNG